MPSPLTRVPWAESCLLEPLHDPALEAHARRLSGVPHPSIRYFARCPWVARTMLRWVPEHGLLSELDLHTSDLIGLVVSQENSCRFCYAAVRALLRIQGMSEARVQRLEQQLAQLDVEPRLAAVVRYSRMLSRCNPPPGPAEVQALLDAGFSPAGVRDIAFAVVATVLFNRISTIAALPVQNMEAAPERLLVKMLRPLIARLLERGRSSGQAAPVPAAYAGPHRALVMGFAGSPVASLLAETLDDMAAAPALTPRCRALMLAVIARALGCRSAGQQAAAQLLAKGFDTETLEQVLAHLDAPQLDPIERELVTFARETVWDQPAQLQRRARQLRERLSAEQFTDALGVVSLANALCRLDLALSVEAA